MGPGAAARVVGCSSAAHTHTQRKPGPSAAAAGSKELARELGGGACSSAGDTDRETDKAAEGHHHADPRWCVRAVIGFPRLSSSPKYRLSRTQTTEPSNGLWIDKLGLAASCKWGADRAWGARVADSGASRRSVRVD